MTEAAASRAPRKRVKKPDAPLPEMQAWTPELAIIPIEQLVFNPAQPRGGGELDLDGLVASLESVCEPYLVQPPTIERLPDGRYLVQMGERRIRSVMQAGWQQVACQVISASDPFTSLVRRLAENMQRRDLHPLDEAASIKNAWLYANAVALEAEAAAKAILAQGMSPLATLEALTSLLDARAFTPTHPPISQQHVLGRLGLAADAEKCKRLLQVLTLHTDVLRAVRGLDMTEAAIRCLGRFEAAQQLTLIDEMTAVPTLTRQVRNIWVATSKHKQTFDEALTNAKQRASRIAAAREQPVEQLPDASALDGLDELAEAIEARAAEPPQPTSASASSEQPSASPIDESDAMERALAILETANTFQSSGEELLALLDGRSVDALPEPWRGYVITAAQIIAATLKSLPLR